MDITDKDRLDAVEQGFCVSAQEELTDNGWVRTWFACYSEHPVFVGTSLREALDAAIIAKRSGIH